MKVTFIIGSLQSGGAERVLTTLANHWVQKGWDITILTFSSAKSFYELDSRVKRVSLLSNYKSSYSALQNLYTLYGLRTIIKKEKSDIFISFITLMNLFVLISTLGLKVPLIISERNYFDQLTNKVKGFLRKILYPKADGMVVLSDYDYKKYPTVESKKIIFNLLNKKKLLDVKFEDKKNIAIAVGSLTQQKGFDMLIPALSKVNLENWKFYIIGEGSERVALELLVKEYGLADKVFLIGRKNNIFDYFKEASIFVLSSRYEGFPNVLAEAMAHGCASVAFDCKTGPADMIQDNLNGLLADANNITDLAGKIELLIADKNLREKFFNNAIRIREILDIDTITQSWESYIQETIEKKYIV